MNGTLFQETSPVSRIGLLPGTNNTLSATWAVNVSKMLLRSAGFAGSVQATIQAVANDGYYHANSIYNGWTLNGNSPIIRLPVAAYGSTYPPAIYVMPSWGSIVVYSNIADGNGNYGLFETLRTWVVNLICGTVAISGTNYFQWEFRIGFVAQYNRHQLTTRPYKPPYEGMMNRTMPPPWVANTIDRKAGYTSLKDDGGIWLHWYAMGYDVNA